MAENLKDRYGPVALVTGASSGIGQSFAQALAAQGFDLVLAARRLDRLNDLAAKLTAAHGVAVTVIESDLAAPSAADDLLAATAGIDIGLVVSNAGFGLKGPFEAGDPGVLAEIMTVNSITPMLLARGFVPRLKARGQNAGTGGGLLFTASVEGLIGCPYSAVYSASKAAIVTLGEALWAELKPAGIDVLTLCPGATDTEAPGKQGIDKSKLANLQSPDEVAALALANLADGPTFIPSDHYRASFDQLRAMPRAQALTMMAGAMKG